MIPELEQVVLKRAVPASGLESGDMGVVVHRYAPDGYEVEFVTGGGDTLALLTLTDEDIRPLSSGDMPHARSLGPRKRG